VKKYSIHISKISILPYFYILYKFDMKFDLSQRNNPTLQI